MTEQTDLSDEFKENVHSDCGHCESLTDNSVDRFRILDLQSRIDDLLAGRPKVTATRAEESTRPFAPFFPNDMHRADALAAAWMNMADEAGGLDGLTVATDHMYESLGEQNYPLGMVEYAAKLFLTHYQPARKVLQMRSLEERQPAMVLPSQDSAIMML